MNHLSLCLSLTLLTALSSFGAPAKKMPLVTIPNDSLTILYGNSLLNRLQEEGTFEAYLQATQAGQKHQYRSMAYVGDQVHFRIRPEKFAPHQAYLTQQWASDKVIIAFGSNESHRGPEGLPAFTDQLRSYLDIIAARHPKNALFLCSPTAAENNSSILNLDVATRNQNLKLYSDAIAQVASEKNATYIDLFAPTQTLFKDSDGQHTLDGMQLNEHGASKVGLLLAQALTNTKANPNTTGFLALKDLVSRKAYEVAQCYHPSNGISYYGTRARDYEYTGEIPHHLKLANQLDQAIWKQASSLNQALPFPKLPILKSNMPSKKGWV